jgi:hypothetical protein
MGLAAAANAKEDLGRIHTGPRAASTDIEIDESGEKTNIKNKMIKTPLSFALPVRSSTIICFRVRTCTQSHE